MPVKDMAAYMRERRRKAVAPIKPPPRPRMSRERLRTLLAGDEHRRRSEARHSNSAEPGPIKCYGDYLRMKAAQEGRIGAPLHSSLDYDAIRGEHTAKLARVREWLDTLKFPDLIAPKDFCAALPEHVRGDLNDAAIYNVVGRYLAAMGAVRVECPRIDRIWIIRRHRHYQAMTGHALAEAYRAQQSGINDSRPRAVCRRSAKSKIRPDTPAGRRTHHGESAAVFERRENKKAG